MKKLLYISLLTTFFLQAQDASEHPSTVINRIKYDQLCRRDAASQGVFRNPKHFCETVDFVQGITLEQAKEHLRDLATDLEPPKDTETKE